MCLLKGVAQEVGQLVSLVRTEGMNQVKLSTVFVLNKSRHLFCTDLYVYRVSSSILCLGGEEMPSEILDHTHFCRCFVLNDITRMAACN